MLVIASCHLVKYTTSLNWIRSLQSPNFGKCWRSRSGDWTNKQKTGKPTSRFLRTKNLKLHRQQVQGRQKGFCIDEAKRGGGGVRGSSPEIFWNLRWLNHPNLYSCSSMQTISKLVVIGIVGKVYLLNDKLSWDDHVNKLYADCARRIGILWRLRNELDSTAFRKIFIGAIRPKMEYTCAVWSGGPTGKIAKLQDAYCRKHQIHLLPLKKRFDSHTLTLFFKMKHQMVLHYLSSLVLAPTSESSR